MFGTNSRLIGDLPTSEKSGALVAIEFRLKLNLLAGDYFVSLGVAQDHESKDAIPVDRRYDLIHLHVSETKEAFGYADLEGDMTLMSEGEV